MRRIAGVVAGVAAVAIAAAAAVNLAPSPAPVAADPVLAFEATFDTASDFYGRFDYGFSGLFIPGQSIGTYHGDHAVAPAPNCGGPTTDRTVTLSGQFATDFSEAFWWCAPSGDATSGHMMTGLTTTGYNHLWFSPQPEFTAISKVCWDINETFEGGKWTELQFVNHADAVRWPTGTITAGGNAQARGTGGFDLGYTDPEFQDPNGPSNGFFGSSDITGLKINVGSVFDWWQNTSTFMHTLIGWPGLLPGNNGGPITDKAARYKTCVENVGTSQITITNARPDGVQSYTVSGHIPQDARRVVFHDAEYDGPKRDGYNANTITWHWDNVQVFTAGPPPPPTTTTVAPTTTVPPTTTTTAPTTTVPPTTTTAATTTTVATTTTLPPTTTTTIAPIPACPSGFTTAQRNWCLAVNAHIAALEAHNPH